MNFWWVALGVGTGIALSAIVGVVLCQIFDETTGRRNEDWFKVWFPPYDEVRRPYRSPYLSEAFDDGFTACAHEHTKQRHDPTHPITRINPYD